jgi:hypothetical protein
MFIEDQYQGKTNLSFSSADCRPTHNLRTKGLVCSKCAKKTPDWLRFEAFKKYGVGQVIMHWTWLPPLRKQLAKASGRHFNAGNGCMIRLMTPLNLRYGDAYLKAHPFDRLVEGMLQPEMVLETLEIVKTAIENGELVNLIINNRAGENAPLIAREIAEKFVDKSRLTPKGQLDLW